MKLKFTKKGFTLAEVLITLAIIGVVAALTIPSVVANTQQQEFKTGLKKAVSVLNSSITMNMAIDGESPYENTDLYTYLARHMSVMKSKTSTPHSIERGSTFHNFAFYTTDGMRFEFVDYWLMNNLVANKKFTVYLHENPKISLRGGIGGYGEDYYLDCKDNLACARCGGYGLANNENNTVNAPCLVVVDVNGDRKPFPTNAACRTGACVSQNTRKYGEPSGRKLTDTFSIMITDKAAVPFGVIAQKAMYEAQK